ncbi:hypothetical protein [Hephaestia caeni]|uniref:hypothetical protein n=1 Tax=Hephaestia caeni TaxID=645617 RepID=UPI0014728E91|nr:hypothetical protein [Hephaestia caeni]
MNNLDRKYIERRRQECLAAAEKAADPGIARVHQKFADEYDRRLKGGQPATLRTG